GGGGWRRQCQRGGAFGCSAYHQSGTAEIDWRRPKMQPTFSGRARGRRLKPNVSRVEIIYDPANPLAAELIRSIDTGAPSLAVQVSSSAIRNSADIERAINALADQRNGGLVVFATPLTGVHRDVIIGLAARHRLPAVYQYRYFVESGGLASYGIDNNDLYRRAVSYVDRVRKGEKPANLPIQYPTKFELVINLKTAKAPGLDVPIPVLARTDEVIE